MAASLRDTVTSPVQPESDEEAAAADDGGKADKDSKTAHGKADQPRVSQTAGIGARLAELPVPAGRYTALHAFASRVLFSALQDVPVDGGATKADLHAFELGKRKDKTVIAGVAPDFSASKDGGKVLYQSED